MLLKLDEGNLPDESNCKARMSSSILSAIEGGKVQYSANIYKDLRVNRQIQIENPFIELHETDMHEVEIIKTGLETKLETDSNIGNLTHLLNCEKSDYKTTRNFS